jgi:hypothetical protein
MAFKILESVMVANQKIKWSEHITTKSGDPVAFFDGSPHAESGYPFLVCIDHGTELGWETYNEDGEWDVGIDSSLNLMQVPRNNKPLIVNGVVKL